METYFLLLLLVAVLLGGLVTYLLVQLSFKGKYLSNSEVESNYVRREVHDQLQREADLHFENLQELRNAEVTLHRQLAATESELKFVKTGAERLQAASLAHFEQAGERLTQQNATQLDHLLAPLKERLNGYEKQAQQRFVEETRDRVSLRQEITNLQALNQQISAEANNLAGALRGSNKIQGDWGEWQLLTLLETSGLQEGIHFRSQSSFRDENGRQKRPDFIINLPESKHLVIDCKVSLSAYERYCNCEENDLVGRQQQSKAHLRSLRSHVNDLASKNYTRLYQINSPDYLLLFVPIEPAYGLALSTDQSIFLEALERHIVIVTPSTLLATLRTVNYIWKQENQKKNVLEIARQGGLLYDGFVSFTEELQKVGQRLEQAQTSYHAALNKLSKGGTYGATLVGRAERLRKLGAKSKKRLGVGFLEEE